MSKATDPIEGYYAQQKAPTIRELLDALDRADDARAEELAERVEAVLRCLDELKGYGFDSQLEEIRRVLNGDESR